MERDAGTIHGMNGLLLQALAAFPALPGVVAFGALYGAAIGVAFHLRVLFHEEPFLARTHGASWTAYAARVPRWARRRRAAEGAR
jgi:protein-S-isoprenylcysteine O-methyltransferase Ste14